MGKDVTLPPQLFPDADAKQKYGTNFKERLIEIPKYGNETPKFGLWLLPWLYLVKTLLDVYMTI